MSRRGQLNFHHVPDHVSDDDDNVNPTIPGPAPILKPRAAKHTRLNHTLPSSTRDTRSYFYTPVPSPAKAPPEPQVWDDDVAFDNDTGGPVDIAYQHHRDTVDVEPNPRAYTQSVSSK